MENPTPGALNLARIKELLAERFGQEVITGEETERLQPALLIDPLRIADVCLELRNNPEAWFDFLSSVTGVDHGAEAGKFTVVYHLASIPHNTQLTLKVILEHGRDPDNLPRVKSVSGVWKAADWHEREVYDLTGIFFEDHPDLRRILLPDDWEGFPLRKDYRAAEYYQGIKID